MVEVENEDVHSYAPTLIFFAARLDPPFALLFAWQTVKVKMMAPNLFRHISQDLGEILHLGIEYNQ